MGLFVYLSCLLPDLWSLNVTNGYFFVFSADDSKRLVRVGAKAFKLARNILLSSFRKWYDYWTLELLIVILGEEISKKLLSQQKVPKFCISKGWHLVAQNPIIYSTFYNEINKIFQTLLLNILPKLLQIFSCHQQKIQTWAIFDILMTMTLGANVINS